MRIKRGKVKFGYRDSYDVEDSLRPIIHDWLVNFKKTLQDIDTRGGCVGVPLTMIDELGEPKSDDGCYDETEIRRGLELWYEKLDEMIFGFSPEPPIPSSVDFIMREHETTAEGFTRVTIDVVDEEAYNRHLEDEKQFYERAEKGRELFAKHFESLWW